jgi:hypothetical protein
MWRARVLWVRVEECDKSQGAGFRERAGFQLRSGETEAGVSVGKLEDNGTELGT